MILTFDSFAKSQQQLSEKSLQRGPLGPRKEEPLVTYSKAGMWSVLVFSCGLAIAGLVLCFTSMAPQNIRAIIVGVLMVLIGNYLLIAAVKEKAILDRFLILLNKLTPETKDEVFRKALKNSLDSSGRVLQLIETILSVFFK